MQLLMLDRIASATADPITPDGCPNCRSRVDALAELRFFVAISFLPESRAVLGRRTCPENIAWAGRQTTLSTCSPTRQECGSAKSACFSSSRKFDCHRRSPFRVRYKVAFPARSPHRDLPIPDSLDHIGR